MPKKGEPSHAHKPDSRRPYLSYLVRLWMEVVEGRPAWRGSLIHVQTREEIAFASWEQLVEFLLAEQRKEEDMSGEL